MIGEKTQLAIDYIRSHKPASTADVARAVGVSVATVEKAKRRIGYKSPLCQKKIWSPCQDEILLSMREDGATFLKISETLNFSQTSVIKRYKELSGGVNEQAELYGVNVFCWPVSQPYERYQPVFGRV